jgi:hypothetical protein
MFYFLNAFYLNGLESSFYTAFCRAFLPALPLGRTLLAQNGGFCCIQCGLHEMAWKGGCWTSDPKIAEDARLSGSDK